MLFFLPMWVRLKASVSLHNPYSRHGRSVRGQTSLVTLSSAALSLCRMSDHIAAEVSLIQVQHWLTGGTCNREVPGIGLLWYKQLAYVRSREKTERCRR